MSEKPEKNPKISKSDFDFLRLKLISIRDKTHWVQLDDQLQKKIIFCLAEITSESLVVLHLKRPFQSTCCIFVQKPSKMIKIIP